MSFISYLGRLAKDHKAELGILVLTGAVTYAATKRHNGHPENYFSRHREPEHFSPRIRTHEDLRAAIANAMLEDAR